MAEMTDQEFVESVVKAIVDVPDGVSTKRSVDEMGVLIELTVAAEDMGKIIGKEGRTAKAVRTLLRVFGAKNNSRINLKIVEPEGSERPERKENDLPADAEHQAMQAGETRIHSTGSGQVTDDEESKEKPEVKKDKTEDVDDVPTDVLA